MSAPASAPPAPVAPPESGLTVEEYYALCDRGAFAQRVELIDGVVELTLSESRFHNAIIQLLLDLFRDFRDEGIYAYTSTVEIDQKNAPDPDVFVCRTPYAKATRADGMQRPDEVLLVVEVSLSTLRKDRGTKVEKYAGADIPEYWIIDPEARRVEVRRDPSGPAYRSVKVVGDKGAIRPLFSPNREITVAAMFPNE